jgi:hypothetical protein
MGGVGRPRLKGSIRKDRAFFASRRRRAGLPSAVREGILTAMTKSDAFFGPMAPVAARTRRADARPLLGLLRLVLIGDRRAH